MRHEHYYNIGIRPDHNIGYTYIHYLYTSLCENYNVKILNKTSHGTTTVVIEGITVCEKVVSNKQYLGPLTCMSVEE